MVSLFQAVTQIQEMTLTFVPKIVVGLAQSALSMPWMMQKMMHLHGAADHSVCPDTCGEEGTDACPIYSTGLLANSSPSS